KDTRAYFRGMCLQKYSEEVVSASWDSVIFDLKEGPLKKIFMLEPLRGTEAHVRQLFAESPTAGDLLRNLGKPAGDVCPGRVIRAGRRRSSTTGRRALLISCGRPRRISCPRPRISAGRRAWDRRACPTAPPCSLSGTGTA